MSNLDELRNELAGINALLSTGVRQSTVDGTQVMFDCDTLRKRKQEIEAQLPETRRRRPRVWRPKLG